MNIRILLVLLVFLIIIDTVPCKNLVSMGDATIATITSDNESALNNAIKKLNSNGGVIYKEIAFF